MIHIKVQYDAYNRSFTLIDREFGSVLEDYAVYDLAIPFTFEGAEEQHSFTSLEMPLAHA